KRIEDMNYLVKEIGNDYIPKAILSASRNGFREYSNNITSQNHFLVNNEDGLISYLNETIVNGTLSGTVINIHSLNHLLSNLSLSIFESINIETNFNVKKDTFEIFQNETSGPWSVGIKIEIDYEVISDLAEWNITGKEFIVYIHIDNLPDPYLSINSNKNYNIRNITQHGNTTWELENFRDHVLNKTYFWGEKSPNYLSRLINSTKDSKCCGIHTFVDEKSKSTGPLEGFYNKSFIDFCYFSNRCDNILYNVTDISNETYPFRIDEFHLTKLYILNSDHYTLIE
ncbi:MAG: hypothetical protein ACMXX8_02195, partial [Candidatus Woesearchaeota archaeon]